MNKFEKAILNLENKGISARLEGDDSIYVYIADTEVEISEFEINFQANEYDELN